MSDLVRVTREEIMRRVSKASFINIIIEFLTTSVNVLVQ